MFKRSLIYLFSLALLITSCEQEKTQRPSFITPEAGTRIKAGSEITIDLDFGKAVKIDSVLYYIDSTLIVSQKDTQVVKATTNGFMLGNHLVTAKIFTGDNVEDVASNITLLAAKAPVKYTYKVINSFPHDTSSYVEGLEYHNGFFYESDGEYGGSTLRKVDPKTGKVVQNVKIPDNYFAEGITVIGDKIIQITYREGIGFEYDLKTFKKLKDFSYHAGKEGWGLCFDGEKILNTDGSNTIYFLDKTTYQKTGSLAVYDDEGAVELLNELECINGKIYANIYDTEGKYNNKIVIINPKSGAVEGVIDLKGLNPETDYPNDADYILNGIAWDAKGKRLFVTGKKWSKLFEIEVK